jgi:hypothetical protein
MALLILSAYVIKADPGHSVLALKGGFLAVKVYITTEDAAGSQSIDYSSAILRRPLRVKSHVSTGD